MLWKVLEKSAELPPVEGEGCKYSLKGGEFTPQDWIAFSRGLAPSLFL